MAGGKRDEGLLYRSGRLEDAVRWTGRYPGRISSLEREFLSASKAVIEREVAEKEAQRQRELAAAQQIADAERKRADDQQRASRNLRVLLSIVAIVAVIALGLAGWAVWQTQQAQSSKEEALMAQAQAESNLSEASRQQAAASRQQAEAERQRTLGRSREIAALTISQIATDKDPERALLLAMEAITVTRVAGLPHTFEAEDALRQALFLPRVDAILSGHAGRVNSAAFSPDGQRIVTASWDKTARVWEAATGQQLAVLSGHEGWLHSAVFSPDGRRIVTTSADGTALIHLVEMDDLMALAQSRVTRQLSCQERVAYLNEALDCSQTKP